VTTTSLIESIIKASEKGQIKIKKVLDNTAKDVEVLIELMPGVSPDLTVDALYAFTDCEISISPNACVIIDNKPRFLGVTDLLIMSTERTKDLLGQELEIKKNELEEKWHLASLEKIFIENRIYHDIEECETWEDVIITIDKGLKKFVATPSDPLKSGDKRIMLMRDITEEDIIKLTEIKIKRISKYNSFKADEYISNLELELQQVKHDIEHLTEFAIAYFERLLEKYGKGRERKTEIISMESIQVQQVVANNAKLYVNKADGFIGMGMKKDEYVCDCSDIDDIIAFTKDGKFKVVRIADKVFIGKDIIHVEVWRKTDDRTTYNLMYIDGGSGTTYAKRFNVTSITRDKEYDLTQGNKGSKVLYFTSNPNGESEKVNVQLSPGCTAKKKVFDFDFADLAIKGRSANGNTVTKYPVRKVTQLEVGKSSLGAIKVWIDEVSGRVNTDGRGRLLGGFDTGELLLVVFNDGTYEYNALDLSKKYEMSNIALITKYTPETPVSVIYFEGEKGWTMVKKFVIETSPSDTKHRFISEAITSKLYHISVGEGVGVVANYKIGKDKLAKELNLDEFISVKGWKAMGNKLVEGKLINVDVVRTPEVAEEAVEESTIVDATDLDDKPLAEGKAKNVVQTNLFGEEEDPKDDKKDGGKYKSGDTIEFDV